MVIYEWLLKPEKLRQMPEDERALFVLLAHVANELNVLNKLFYICSQHRKDEKWHIHAHTTQALIIARLFVGKLYEAWEALQQGYFKSMLGRKYTPLLPADAKESLSKLKKYFGKPNIVRELRNNFAFHYSLEHIKGTLNKNLNKDEPDSSEMIAYMSNSIGNTLYYFSESVIGAAILEKIDQSQPAAAFDKLIVESTDLMAWFNEFIGGIMFLFCEKYMLEDDGKITLLPINIGSIPLAESIEIPYFIELKVPVE
ncbi:hypothetical protein ACFSKY_14515 [Azotobacter chroococcum]|uniref:HEPN AbiU2-like domain-containing protein n=1 Tax=Azotobacter chroococcum TaxID=353 RepID=A0A4V2Q783_9GAMM|nr:hypothetical protein [Azotobacter chroococcum]TBV96695.1 hypothetical protein E0E53_09830 [Azotobacter chroococcum]TCL27150.1 hypothetical protein EV691_12730 [Azotobacter chroococcum]